jgi:hypothetical protein
MKSLLPIREFIIKNFLVSIKTIQTNKIIIKHNIFFYLFNLIPFFILKRLFNCFNLKYIYLMDNLYFSNYSNENKTSPVLMSFHGGYSKDLETDTFLQDDRINLMDSYKKYNSSVPLWFFIENEKIKNITILYMNYFSKGKMNKKEFIIKDNKEVLLGDIF